MSKRTRRQRDRAKFQPGQITYAAFGPHTREVARADHTDILRALGRPPGTGRLAPSLRMRSTR